MLYGAYRAFRVNWKFEAVRNTGTALPRLVRGDSGPAVARLQALLNMAGQRIDIDGAFGAATAEAVREFKRIQGLPVDGTCGRSCWMALLGAE
jgi:peptidoglycan hydrolase-like protein with peptidoglycan-binding domain